MPTDELQLSDRIEGALEPAFLRLQSEASAPYDDFVYADEREARRAQRVLFDARAGEWAPPHARAAISDGALVGIVAGMPTGELQRARLNAALVLARAGVTQDPAVAQRMRLATDTFVRPRADDYYYSLLAVEPDLRGSGVVHEVIGLARLRARESGARRLVFQAAGDRPALIAFYERAGYESIGESTAVDPESGRTLCYRHLATAL